ncbi:flagellar type III secretion system protein FlhB [Vibrio sp. V27_P1S3P104]|uniref:flagellar biosynthesis protein FlhB n=1 Tax=unclassified Vibrio TaxID=2614977 RepID=UPI001372D7B0|nr:MULTISPECIES: flagellar biosynthesis protein FlhB [unclassified Vibrio]NAW70627.1 flagellar type III secretion system protein FlhB [Vibrio sp. V28_P6S34P95]NAX05104.1 flagellar type III secretion system protein FlhB [Vibrio sp. V30_P3S12P165]NAX35561.1 flagellar type III secretion system protein FlhB [Vibrio sp. V29_P1S30P107]NAX36860.1 flagellar type III secretion system protein FlhB [Vibrio sp. V27_P1S3P104]NAX40086.1 flagellar type III secretion system protein FlhB [Vibrio sp. V26_P1S5P1
MSDQSSQDKTEKASPQKIKKARQEGQIPRAKELTTAVIFLAVTLYFYAQFPQISQRIIGIFRYNMTLTKDDLASPNQMIEQLGQTLAILIELLLPMFVVIIVVSIASTLLLGGWLFRPANVLPKLSKLNPLSGLKRMFSTRSLVELIKSTLKVSVIFAMLYGYLDNHLQPLLGMQNLPLNQGVTIIMSILFDGLLLMGFALLIFGVIDVPYQRWEHLKQLKMTKQELKEEFKNNEGRPEIKQRIRQIQQQFARRKIEKMVPTADVIITNPTHYAVALKYDTNLAEAPFVVAKGVDETALHIQRIARENHVEIIHAPPLTRSIYHTTAIEQAIPSQLYIAVAHILTYVLQLKAFRKGAGKKPHPLPIFSIPKHLQH